MDLDDFIRCAKAYRDLGRAITDQLDAVLEEGIDVDPAEINVNALALIDSELTSLLVETEVDGADDALMTIRDLICLERDR